MRNDLINLKEIINRKNGKLQNNNRPTEEKGERTIDDFIGQKDQRRFIVGTGDETADLELWNTVLDKSLKINDNIQKYIEVIPKIKKLVKEELANNKDSKRRKEAKRRIQGILKSFKDLEGGVYEMAVSKVQITRLFQAIENDLERLENWKSGNPWECLSTNSYQAVKIGFARKVTREEGAQIRERTYRGTHIHYKITGKRGWKESWIMIVPTEPESNTGKALFDRLHKLRLACKKQVSKHKRNRRS
ncbi:MAG: hypothetical protein WD607_11040 [Candidatus Paceibacterota bacterium]